MPYISTLLVSFPTSQKKLNILISNKTKKWTYSTIVPTFFNSTLKILNFWNSLCAAKISLMKIKIMKNSTILTHHPGCFQTTCRPNIPTESDAISIFILMNKLLICSHFYLPLSVFFSSLHSAQYLMNAEPTQWWSFLQSSWEYIFRYFIDFFFIQIGFMNWMDWTKKQAGKHPKHNTPQYTFERVGPLSGNPCSVSGLSTLPYLIRTWQNRAGTSGLCSYPRFFQ